MLGNSTAQLTIPRFQGANIIIFLKLSALFILFRKNLFLSTTTMHNATMHNAQCIIRLRLLKNPNKFGFSLGLHYVDACGIEIRRRLGKIQINLVFHSACTNFAY